MPTSADYSFEIAATAHSDVEEVLFSAADIAMRVAQLGAAITRDYAALDADELTVVGVANGALIFTADLLRRINLRTRFDTVRVSSYLDGTSPSAAPQFRSTVHLNLAGRHVLIVDDILDTGRTLSQLHSALLEHRPASLRTCVLLDKKSRRQTPFEAAYTGFDIPDAFVVGYGMDFAERYRNLPFVGVLRADRQVAGD
ncbi:MAG: hypoxanthine phosphoribosyltransferase [Puniceicoccales bacterium]|jgi:hypoxanthine phosphoribosyltransferase|nr:hypoxanthine phosphoribosyltransferase [Puniceicoccales bacterium]